MHGRSRTIDANSRDIIDNSNSDSKKIDLLTIKEEEEQETIPATLDSFFVKNRVSDI
jgi:hypothetical protein